MHTKKNNKDKYRNRYKRIDNQFKKAIGQKKFDQGNCGGEIRGKKNRCKV